MSVNYMSKFGLKPTAVRERGSEAEAARAGLPAAAASRDQAPCGRGRPCLG